MSTKPLEIEVALQIQQPIATVYEAIINPEKMSNYFISESSGKMVANTTVMWKFPEFDESYPVKVGTLRENEYISYHWMVGDTELFVEMQLTPKENNSTLVTITEKSMENNEKGLQWLSGNSFGWSNFLACLKAYVEYGINLRKGAFDFMKPENGCGLK